MKFGVCGFCVCFFFMVDFMIIFVFIDYCVVVECWLLLFLFYYIDGGVYVEYMLKCNVFDLFDIVLCQCILCNMFDLSLEIELFGEKLVMLVVLVLVGLIGMYVWCGEVQVVCVVDGCGILFILFMVLVCLIEEVVLVIQWLMWFQLYVLCDRGFMCNVLEWVQVVGVIMLVFIVDMLVLGVCYCDVYLGMSGLNVLLCCIGQVIIYLYWVWDVGLFGCLYDLGNIFIYRGNFIGLEDYIGWLGSNFDFFILWKDLEWICEFWKGLMVIKGIFDLDDVCDVVKFGVDGIVVFNYGGCQLDGVLFIVCVLLVIVDVVQGDLKIFVDFGICIGLDVVCMLVLGVDVVLLGCVFIYVLVVQGEVGVVNLLDLIGKEMCVVMILIGVCCIVDIGCDLLVSLL